MMIREQTKWSLEPGPLKMMTETDDQLVSGNASIITVLKSMAKIPNPESS
jgi:hypothetical protein